MDEKVASLRLKVVADSLKRQIDGNGDCIAEEIALSAVHGNTGTVNAEWSKYTPSAHLTMYVTNPAAFGKVAPGQFFFVDLIPTTKEA